MNAQGLESWAIPRLRQLLPLDEDNAKQLIQYVDSLPKDAAAEHLRNLLGDEPKALEFISGFNFRRKTAAPSNVGGSSTTVASASTSHERGKTTVRGGRVGKKNATIHALPARQVEGQGSVAGAYRKDNEQDYMPRRERAAQTHTDRVADNLALRHQKPDATQMPLITDLAGPSQQPVRVKQPPSAAGALISDSLAPSSSSKAKVRISGGTAMHGASSALSDLDSAIRSLEIQTNPTLSSSTPADEARRRCNCMATRHPLLDIAPNCLNCGKIICIKQGLGPCTFCGHPLLSADEINKVLRILKDERGEEKMKVNNAAHRKADVAHGKARALTGRDFLAQASSNHSSPLSSAGPGTPADSEDEATTKAKAHRDKLLSFQANNARRTQIHDEAADFDIPASGTNMWSSPQERALQLKKQQRALREMEWNARPEYEKRRVVASIDVKGGKVVRRMADVEKPDFSAEEENDVELQADFLPPAADGNAGAFSNNPLARGLIRPQAKEIGAKGTARGERKTWRRVQMDEDDNEAWILDGGVYGGRIPDDRVLGAEEHAAGMHVHNNHRPQIRISGHPASSPPPKVSHIIRLHEQDMAYAAVVLAFVAVAYAQSPIVNTKPGSNFTWVNCYSNSPKAIDGYTLDSSTEKMTPECCASYCSNNPYFGIYNGDTCTCTGGFASSPLPPNDPARSGVQCDYSCLGNDNARCGGLNAFDLYAKPGLTTTGVPPAKTGYVYQSNCAIVDSIPNGDGNTYTYIGCYRDQQDPSRALTGKSSQTGYRSPRACANFCTGFRYFGVENGGQCYCGSQISNSNTLAPCQAECNQCCADNSAQRCGGYYRLSMYEVNSLNRANYVRSAQADTCTYNGPTQQAVVSGTTTTVYGQVTTATSTSSVLTTDASGKTVTTVTTFYFCNGGACNSETYKTGNPTTVARINTDTTGPDAAYTPTPQAPCSGCEYYGCVDDDGAGRALQYRQDTLDETKMTQELCVDACFAAGYRFAGVEYAQQCYCDGLINPPHANITGTKYTVNDHHLLTCSEPEYLCKGNTAQQCGGFAALDVWDCQARLASASTTTTPGTTTTRGTTTTLGTTTALGTTTSRIVTSGTTTTSSSTSIVTSRDGCPLINDTTETDPYGAVYRITCGRDSSAGAYGSKTYPNGNFRQCFVDCDLDPRCDGFSWNPYPDNGAICYLKDTDSTDTFRPVDNPNLVYCERVQGPTSIPTTTVTSTSTSSTTQTSSSSSSPSTTVTTTAATLTSSTTSSTSAASTSSTPSPSSPSSTSSSSTTSTSFTSTFTTPSASTTSTTSGSATSTLTSSSTTSASSSTSSSSSRSTTATSSASSSGPSSTTSSSVSSSLSSSGSSTTSSSPTSSSTTSSSSSSSSSSAISSSSTSTTTSSSSLGSMSTSSLFGSSTSPTMSGMCMCKPSSSCSKRTTVITYTIWDSTSSPALPAMPQVTPSTSSHAATAPQYATPLQYAPVY